MNITWNKYFCTGCSCTKLEYVYYDPTNDEITVVVNTGDGEKEVNVKANAVFQVLKDAQGNKYTITAVKAFDSYEADQIVAIYIPAGISEVKILSSNSNSSIKKITFGAELDATVTSLVGLQSLENIVIENVKKLVFEGECAAKTIKSIKSDFPGATVEYKDSAFIGQTNLTELKLSKGSMYSFGAKSFGDTGVTSLEFVDGCIVSFTGKQAFYNSKLEYLYVGKGIIDLPNSPFDCCYYLQKVILMDVTNISEYAFRSMNKGQNPCVVYHHAETLTLNVNSFNQSHGVILYTKANSTIDL